MERTTTRTCKTRSLRDSYNKRRWGSDSWVTGMKRSGEKDGALFRNWKYCLMGRSTPRVWPNTLNPHRLLAYARSIHFPKITELIERLFSLTYEEGENISSIKVLERTAKEIGLEGAESVLRSTQFFEQVVDEDEFAKRDLEIKFMKIVECNW